MESEGKKILLVNVPKQPYYMMERIDIIPNLVPCELVFDNIEDCMAWVKENVEDVV